MAEKYIPMNEKQLTALKTYLYSRLGAYDVERWEFEHEVDKKNRYETLSQLLDVSKAAGIFTYALQHLSIEAQIHNYGDNRNWHVRLTLRYQHHGGGYNGAELNIKLIVHNDGTVFEKRVE